MQDDGPHKCEGIPLIISWRLWPVFMGCVTKNPKIALGSLQRHISLHAVSSVVPCLAMARSHCGRAVREERCERVLLPGQDRCCRRGARDLRQSRLSCLVATASQSSQGETLRRWTKVLGTPLNQTQHM